MIYVNASSVRGLEDWPIDEFPELDWRTVPIKVCDGGSDHWGVVYDPERRRFFDLAFNGSV